MKSEKEIENELWDLFCYEGSRIDREFYYRVNEDEIMIMTVSIVRNCDG